MATNDNCLLITHVNALFGCESTITAAVKTEENVIYITEDATDAGVNCVCPYDLTIKVGPLKNEKYKIVVLRDNYQIVYCMFDIDYTSTLKGELVSYTTE